MTTSLKAGTYTIRSVLQWNVPLGVKATKSISQPIVSDAPEVEFNLIPQEDGRYRISIGRYAAIGSVIKSFMDYAVFANMNPVVSAIWTLTHHENFNAYTISIEDPYGLGPLAWTIGKKLDSEEPVELRPMLETDGPFFTKSQLFRITPV